MGRVCRFQEGCARKRLGRTIARLHRIFYVDPTTRPPSNQRVTREPGRVSTHVGITFSGFPREFCKLIARRFVAGVDSTLEASELANCGHESWKSAWIENDRIAAMPVIECSCGMIMSLSTGERRCSCIRCGGVEFRVVEKSGCLRPDLSSTVELSRTDRRRSQPLDWMPFGVAGVASPEESAKA